MYFDVNQGWVQVSQMHVPACCGWNQQPLMELICVMKSMP